MGSGMNSGSSCLLPYRFFWRPDRIRRALAAADIYVTAGPHETFGLSVIEAEASGLPVVGVDAGALRELDGQAPSDSAAGRTVARA